MELEARLSSIENRLNGGLTPAEAVQLMQQAGILARQLRLSRIALARAVAAVPRPPTLRKAPK